MGRGTVSVILAVAALALGTVSVVAGVALAAAVAVNAALLTAFAECEG